MGPEALHCRNVELQWLFHA